MVEDFTKTKEEAYIGDVQEIIVQIDEEFEAKVKYNIQNLAKEPRQHIIDDILNYSKSLSKN